MEIHRRKFLHLTASAAAISAASRIASADSYPSRPIRLIVGFTDGAASDVIARIFARARGLSLVSKSSSRISLAQVQASPRNMSPARRRTATRCSFPRSQL